MHKDNTIMTNTGTRTGIVISSYTGTGSISSLVIFLASMAISFFLLNVVSGATNNYSLQYLYS